jgi:hypothetical protein
MLFRRMQRNKSTHSKSSEKACHEMKKMQMDMTERHEEDSEELLSDY